MQFCDINDIPRLVKIGKMTVSEGAKMISGIVQTNPHSFGLQHLNSTISRFLMENFRESCGNIIKIFDPKGGTMLYQLTDYLHYLVRQHKHLWLKAQHVHTVFDDEEDPPRMHGRRRISHEIVLRRKRAFRHHQSGRLSLPCMM